MISKKLIENLQFSGILTKIQTMPKKQKKFLKKLERHMQSFLTKKSVKFLTNMVKKDWIHQRNQETITEVSPLA